MQDLERLNLALAQRYRVSGEIGRGGMATVYQADDLRHGRRVAIKVLKPELAAVLGSERFLREIKVTAGLDHAHIIPLLDSGEADGLLFYVMPFVDGESLRARIDREKQLPLDDALRITREVADALSHAHRQGIIHRDIKPENILLSGTHARVADFGIARAVTAAGQSSLTETGLAIGTPTYMSPEQSAGEATVDARADIYSLGCVLYEMLAGQPPYTGATAAAILARKSMEAVPNLKLVRDTVPHSVEQAVRKALARVPADRFASAEQFAAALGSSSTPDAAPRSRSRTRFYFAGAAILAVVAALLVNTWSGERDGTALRRIESLAVLPLENLSNDPQQDYLAAGMHEALIVGLGRLSALKRVSARPSVLRFQGGETSPYEIADELGVDALITGTVTRAGEKVRITANLVDPASGATLWSKSYEREVRDVLTLQNEVVAAIAQEVELQLSPGEAAALSRTRQVHPEAYQDYLKGKYQLGQFTPEGFEQAMTLFNQAIRIDPQEPLAWTGLAQGYVLMELFRPASSPDDVARAKAAALKAVELDSTLAEAHLALGVVQGSKEWDHEGSARSVRRALELNPNLAEAHIGYAQYLSIFGSKSEALREWKRGIELDPLSPLYTAWLAGAYWEFGDPDSALVEARKALELQPDFPVALVVLGLSHLDKGEFAEAIAAHEKALTLYPNQGYSWILARTCALSGQRSRALEILAGLESGKPADAPHPWFIAAAYVALGKNEKALDWLEKAYQDRILFLANLGRDRAAGANFQPLREHPRFKSLLQRLNLD